METATTLTPAPASCHVMAKPSGSVCNIDCKYCFYLEKEKLYPDASKNWRMSDETLELYVKQYIEAQDVPQVITYNSLQEGVGRFGWSYVETADLKKLQSRIIIDLCIFNGIVYIYFYAT